MNALLITQGDPEQGTFADDVGRCGIRLTRMRRGKQAIEATADMDVVFLELGLPDFDGLTLCRAIRATSAASIVALTPPSDVDLQSRSSHACADSFVTMPVDACQLIAGFGATRRRPRPQVATDVRRDDVVVHLLRQRVTVAGMPVLMSRKEYQVLALISAADGAVCPRERIVAEIWGPGATGADNTLYVHVAMLRAKLARPGLIETVRGAGYRLGGRPMPKP